MSPSQNMEIEYIIAGPEMEANRMACTKTTQTVHNEYRNVFTGVWMPKRQILFQVEDDMKLYQVSPRHVVYALQEPFVRELERLQDQQMLAPLGLYATVKWCESFVTVPNPNGTVHLCLVPIRLNQALTWPVHKGPPINDILSKLTNACFMTIIDVSSGYHNLKPDKKSSYLTTFAYQFGRY